MESQGITLLFWNIHGNSRKNKDSPDALRKRDKITKSVGRISRRYNVHVVLLAESDFWEDDAAVLGGLNGFPGLDSATTFKAITRTRQRIQVFSQFQVGQWSMLQAREYYSIWRLLLADRKVLLISAVHFPPFQHDQGDGQRHIAGLLRQDLDRLEPLYCKEPMTPGRFRGAPLIVIGDFNASPFDAGLVASYGLNATPDREYAERIGYRAYGDEVVPYFFNPTWRFLFPTEQESFTGTYYFRSEESPVWLRWYVLDQVLIRPCLKIVKLEIIKSDGSVSLLSKPNSFLNSPVPNVSDHLPLLVTIRV